MRRLCNFLGASSQRETSTKRRIVTPTCSLLNIALHTYTTMRLPAASTTGSSTPQIATPHALVDDGAPPQTENYTLRGRNGIPVMCRATIKLSGADISEYLTLGLWFLSRPEYFLHTLYLGQNIRFLIKREPRNLMFYLLRKKVLQTVEPNFFFHSNMDQDFFCTKTWGREIFFYKNPASRLFNGRSLTEQGLHVRPVIAGVRDQDGNTSWKFDLPDTHLHAVFHSTYRLLGLVNSRAVYFWLELNR